MINNQLEQVENIVEYHHDAPFFYERGVQACNRGDYERALLYFEHAITLDPTNDDIYLKLAHVLFELGDNQSSLELLYTMIYERNIQHEDCYYLLAHHCFYVGKHFEAKKYAEKYIKMTTTLRYMEEAMIICESVVYEEVTEEQQDDELPLLLDEASFYVQKRNLEKAIAIYEQIIEDFPTCWAAYNNLAIAYFHHADIKSAFRMVALTLERNPGNLHALCNKIIFLHAIGDTKSLKEQALQLSAIHPFSHYQYFKLGTTLATVGEYEVAYKWLYHLYQRGYEGEFTYYYWLAYCAFMMNEKQLANEIWAKVVMLNPDREEKEPWYDLSEWACREDGKAVLLQQEKEDIFLRTFTSPIADSEKVATFFYYTQLTDDVSIRQTLGPYITNEVVAELIAGEGNQQKRIEDAFLVAEKLFGHTKLENMVVKNCIFLWFHMLIQIWPEGIWFENHNAWASAVEYTLRKRLGFPTTQVEIGEKYGVKPTMLRKYTKLIKEFVE